MWHFPIKKSDILLLANQVLTAVRQNVALYPDPPFELKILEALIEKVMGDNSKVIAARAYLSELEKEEADNLKSMTELLKELVRYVRSVAGDDPSKLEKGGLSGIDTKKSLPKAPGQCTFFEIISRGATRIKFKWKKPKSGGAVHFYRIERLEIRENQVEVWITVGATQFVELEIIDQPIGIDFQYRVIPINRTGSGEPSNVVSVRF